MLRRSKKKVWSFNNAATDPRVWLVILLALSLGLAAPAWADPRSVTLKSAVIGDFASPAPIDLTVVKPNFKEKDFPLKDAENLKDVQAFIGSLTPTEKSFLEKNRFLLRPKPAFLPAGSDYDLPPDEMLAWFDALGGAPLRSERKGANARLVTPDVFLHAWHTYMETRLTAVERGPLLRTARFMLTELYRNSAELRNEAGSGADDWERLMAQLVVPLILLDEAEADGASDLQSALARFDSYRGDLPPTLARDVRTELTRVYRAEAQAPNLLGLVPVEGGEAMDYRRFQPHGRYAGDPLGRGYYRAMTWLNQLGWDARAESGLADALNCALAMSYERPVKSPAPEAGEGGAPKSDVKKAAAVSALETPRQAWVRFMEISAFFFGYPESPSYLEWLPLMMKEAGVPEFTAATSSDVAVLKRLALAADMLAPPIRPYFKDWRFNSPTGSQVLCLLPRRRSPSSLIAEELHESNSGSGPSVSSALWIPALLGHREAGEMLPRQVALTRPSSPGLTPESDPQQAAVAALNGRLAKLAARLKAEPDAAWFANSETARLKLLSTLAVCRESGYPLYMRSPAFPVRQLEAILGAYAELKHEPAYSATTIGTPASMPTEPLLGDQEPAPLVKGLVEPNPDFWREMIRVADYTRSGFKKYGLFPEDLEDFGPLTRFLKRLERCAALTEKELTGQALSEDDYEFIRLFSLAWMAQPPGEAGGRLPEEEIRSGLVTPIQVLPPEVDGGLVVYEGSAEPWLMLALVGNEKSPRVVLGLTYSHYEFAGPFEPRLTSTVWQLAAYARYRAAPNRGGPTLPARNFWYEALKP